MKERMKKLRKTLGLTQQEFADRLGIGRGNIATYETRDGNPGNSVIALICREFNVNETWLRTGEGEMFLHTPDTMADRLAKEYGLDDLGRQIMSAYLNLNENDRLAVGRMLQNLIDGQSNSSATAPDTSGQEQTEVESLAQQAAQLTRDQGHSEKEPDTQASSASGSGAV